MPFEVGQKVRIKENAYEGSDDPRDIAMRGQVVTLWYDLEKYFGSTWEGLWGAMTDSGQQIQLKEEEIELVEQNASSGEVAALT